MQALGGDAPPAPVLFSTTTGAPMRSLSRSATSRDAVGTAAGRIAHHDGQRAVQRRLGLDGGQAATLAAKARPVAQPLNLLRIAISWFAAALALPGRLAGCRGHSPWLLRGYSLCPAHAQMGK